MKRFLAVALLLLVPSLVSAGTIPQYAEAAQFPSDNAGKCSKLPLDPDGEARYTVVRANVSGSPGCEFFVPVAFPEDAGNTWTAKFHNETPIGVTGNCQFTVTVTCMPDGADPYTSDIFHQFAGGTATTTHSLNQRRQISAATGSFAVTDQETEVGCDSTDCQNTDCIASIRASGASNAVPCDFRMIEFSY